MQLEDRYLRQNGMVYLNGMQAFVRLAIDQNRRDRAAGLRIGTFISGYPGSPLGSFDLALQQASSILREHDIVHVPGANEELAATALTGTQMLDEFPHSRFDGVVSMWYGKGPGVDRSGDAMKHGNFAGTSRHGAVLVLGGDDHESKSSTMPHQSDYAFVNAGIPIVYPATTDEFLHLGLHAIALSRYSGCWIAMKVVNQLADGGAIFEVQPDHPQIVIPEFEINGRPFQKSTDFKFYPGLNIETERRLYEERHRAVIAYARANRLNRIEVRSAGDRLGIVAAGKSYTDVRAALGAMGFDENELRRCGIRLLRLGLIYPADTEIVRDFACDLDEVIVVEEKRGFVETQVKAALCSLGRSIRVVGKSDENDAVLFPVQGGMDSDAVVRLLGPRLLKRIPDHPGINARLAELHAIASRHYEANLPRTPNYCSGCPHNISTRLLDGEIAWGSPGCHAFAAIIDQPQRHITSMTQLGGEGLPWIGLAQFTDKRHMVQNVGDGSYFHSSALNIRFCVAAGVNITFKLLYNGFVANTGAQAPVGSKPIPELTRALQLDGVKRIAVLTQNRRAYRNVQLASNAYVYDVREQERALKELEQENGVTVLIYDGMCANERRRRQKRGKLPPPNRFVFINEEVCEGCGHCGELTNCMSLHKVKTEFGQKTQIHASSCNQDYSCLGGDCPSFVTVETKPGTGFRRPSVPALEGDAVAEPPHRPALDRPYHIYIPGVGGTGVITLNALLSWAALIDGKYALSYDQTGSAQKWGPVLSSIVLASGREALVANKVEASHADLYLACDMMAGAAAVNLDRCDPRRTAAVINTTLLPAGEMIRQVNTMPDPERMRASIARYSDPSRTVSVEARRYAEGLFGDYMATNMFTLGVAYQSGLVPVSAASIEAAIELNKTQVSQNLQAFRYGRLYVAEPERVRKLVDAPRRTWEGERDHALARLRSGDARTYTSLIQRCRHLDEESRRMLAIRIAELIEYQNAAYAGSYVDFVLSVAESERQAVGEAGEITRTVIRYLHKLMAYKDEYEVARLYLKPEFQARVRDTFANPQRIVYNFHPPLLRAWGLKRKMEFGPWFTPVLRVLRALRSLRGGRFDIFGYAEVRRKERELIGWYKKEINSALRQLTRENYAAAVETARRPDSIRGYEEIKLRNASAAMARIPVPSQAPADKALAG
jgi:indolepyruvate ferredoxin oxidoreductase